MSAKIKCKRCGSILESTHRHHFVSCKCLDETESQRGCFIDGGNDPYTRLGGNFEDILIFDENTNEFVEMKNN